MNFLMQFWMSNICSCKGIEFFSKIMFFRYFREHIIFLFCFLLLFKHFWGKCLIWAKHYLVLISFSLLSTSPASV